MVDNKQLQNIDIKKMLDYKKPEQFSTFTQRDAILYSLAIGYSKDPMNEDDLQYTYEKNKDFKIFPTFSCVHNQIDFVNDFIKIPGPEVDPDMIVHGEQNLEIFKPLKANTQYKTIANIVDIQDKGKGTIYRMKYSTYEMLQNQQLDLTYTYVMSVFIRGLTGLKYQGTSYVSDIPKQPTKQPDGVYEEKISKNQAIIYRLTGDVNPLHIDPKVAKKVGFEQPILHGLCFYGIAAKAVIKTFCNGQSDLIRKINCRFTASVYPGETIKFLMWKDQDNKIIVSGIVEQRKKQVIYGYVQLKNLPKL